MWEGGWGGWIDGFIWAGCMIGRMHAKSMDGLGGRYRGGFFSTGAIVTEFQHRHHTSPFLSTAEF